MWKFHAFHLLICYRIFFHDTEHKMVDLSIVSWFFGKPRCKGEDIHILISISIFSYITKHHKIQKLINLYIIYFYFSFHSLEFNFINDHKKYKNACISNNKFIKALANYFHSTFNKVDSQWFTSAYIAIDTCLKFVLISVDQNIWFALTMNMQN